ncbi:UDP-N-acetylglucosamine 1-carboxyvinyltransferase [Lachnospiraceae bacterium NSJ-143]|nr:UDP-N-acetylglucosamine 1-carboxyvinyltransferase [Lachnospiraceae bacterium NSJ-143]
MGRYIVFGGKKLIGATDIHGSKNAALPILCACLVNSGLNVIHNCPKITDVFNTLEILSKAGCSVKWDKSTVIVDSAKAHFIVLDDEIIGKMRSSIIFLGAFLGRFKKAVIAKPGGCRIGRRPLDIHFEALERMGAVITDNGRCFVCSVEKLKGSEIELRLPSVGATENILLAAAFAEGRTVIKNAAREPEISALAEFMKCIGIETNFDSSGVITVNGTDSFSDGEFRIIADRIEAGTYMSACACAGGEIFLRNAEASQMSEIIDVFVKAGSKVSYCDGGIYMKSSENGISPLNIKTSVYPGFPTDMQPQIMSVLTLAEGTSIIIESVFENRFSHALELNKMGANIEIDSLKATIKGVNALKGAEVNAFDLRAGAGLIAAALSCGEMSVINGSQYVKRGYESIEKSLTDLGAMIRYEE